MRYELADYEWTAIKPMLPNKPRGVPRVNDRRVLNGIFWVLRSGAPWRDLPAAFGPYTTCYNRFVRWRWVGVWGRIIDALPLAMMPRYASVSGLPVFDGAGRFIGYRGVGRHITERVRVLSARTQSAI